MPKRSKISPLESNTILRKFSILFFALSALPVILVFYFYGIIREIIDVENSFIIPFLLIVIGICIGYWGMRVVLKDLVKVVKVHTKSLENLLGPKRLKELTAGSNEIAILARTFDEVLYLLEDNVQRLELTKKTLYSVLNKIGGGLSAIEDIDSFLELILETIADALNAKMGLLILADENTDKFSIKAAYGVNLAGFPTEGIKIGKGKLASIMETKKPSFISSFEKNELPSRLQEILSSVPVLGAPLLSHDKSIGIIAIGVRPEAELDDEELGLLFNIALQTAVAIENSKLNEDAEKIYFETISALALAVEAKDKYSRGHLDRVANYAFKIADKLNLNEEDKSVLRDAARLHDIGKIGILDEVLRKPTKLTKEEMGLMKKHPEIGEGIISPIRSLRSLCDIVRHHHEYIDGTGYPDKLKDEKISFLTRILVVADIYDALTTRRPYRDVLSKEEAKRIITDEFAQKLDQKIVKILFEVI